MSTTLQLDWVKLHQNSRQYFSKLAKTPWAMLLDSGNSAHVDSRFDIIVSDPIATLTTRAGQTTIKYLATDHTVVSQQDPLTLVDQVINELLCDDQATDLPFSGGALGYFSYDLGRRFEQLNDRAVQDIALPEMAIGIYDHALIFNRKSDRVTLVTRGTHQQHQQHLAKVLSNADALTSEPFKLLSPWRHQISRHQYQQGFAAIQEYLRSGDCYQINYTQRFESSYSGDEYHAYLALCQQNEMPFSAYLKLEHGAILSVSPERFISCGGGRIEAKPIKGTRPRGANPLEDAMLAEQLVNSEKDQAENLMIVDLLRNDIGRCATPGSVKVPKLFDIESFPGVHHLVSTVHAELACDKTPLDLLRGSFPGGSITGAPKVRAMNIIDQLEPQRRSIYCGSIGYISVDKKMDTNITIRTLLCLDNNIYCWAGGGIVADSNVDDEYQECFDKVAKILPVLSEL